MGESAPTAWVRTPLSERGFLDASPKRFHVSHDAAFLRPYNTTCTLRVDTDKTEFWDLANEAMAVISTLKLMQTYINEYLRAILISIAIKIQINTRDSIRTSVLIVMATRLWKWIFFWQNARFDGGDFQHFRRNGNFKSNGMEWENEVGKYWGSLILRTLRKSHQVTLSTIQFIVF